MQVGGQAVLEGVMMRAPGMVATAVRRVDRTIAIERTPFRSLAEKYAWLRLPVVRGAVALVEMMVMGIRTLNFSAEIAFKDAENPPEDGEQRSPEVKPAKKREKVLLALTVVVALVIATGLFFAVPLIITTSIPGVQQLPLVFNLIAGAIRVSILLGYLTMISRAKDVQRLFQYHGAEHKAVFAYERGLPLTVSSAKAQSRFHPRCGTSLLLVVMVASVMLFAVLDTLVIALAGPLTIVTRLSTHLPLIPIIGGISYELLKLSARKAESPLGRFLVAPGLWLQRITTREPDNDQLEVALVALRSALGQEVALEAPVFPSTVSVN